eukprot:UN27140
MKILLDRSNREGSQGKLKLKPEVRVEKVLTKNPQFRFFQSISEVEKSGNLF